MESLTIKMAYAVMEAMFPHIVKDNGSSEIGQELAIFRSGAKLYYRGKGMWTISGYAQDGSDVDEAILELLKFRRNMKRDNDGL